jgi:hypothetical protein
MSMRSGTRLTSSRAREALRLRTGVQEPGPELDRELRGDIVGLAPHTMSAGSSRAKTTPTPMKNTPAEV